MKKSFILLALSLTMLSASADYRRVDYAGYRISSSDVMKDQTRISSPRLPCAVYDAGQQTSVTLTASEENGQKIVGWWAYQTKGHTQYDNIVHLASGVYSFDWTYNTASYSPAYVVVDYDYIKYNLSYNANGGSGTFPAQNNIIYTNAVSISANTPSRTGYTWGGWTNNLTTTVWHGGETVTGESLGLRSIVDGSNVVLRAKWTANTYTISLGQQGGTGGTTSATATYGAAMPSITVPTRTGYTFGGYFTEKSGGGTQYYNADGTSAKAWDKTSNWTLYAKWTVNQYDLTLSLGAHVTKIYYKINGAANWTAITTKTTLSVNYASTWYGYAEASPGYTAYHHDSGNPYSSSKAASAESLTFAARANTYTVTLDMQSGTGGSPSVTATYGAAMPSITMPMRTGYTFGGYYTIKNGGGVKYYNADGSSVKEWDIDSSNPVLYANWTPVTYTVTLDRHEGSGGDSSAIVTYDADMPQVKVPERTGYDFAGYYTDVNGGGTQYYASNGTSARKWDMTASTTLYAKWTAKKYTVTLDRQGGTGGLASVYATYGDAMPSATMPTRKGYAFGGYYDEENGGGTQYYTADGSSASTWNKSAATTLYAKWTANTYMVEFDANGGDGGKMSDQPFEYDTPQELTSNAFTKTGYSFAGWAKSDSGSVTYTDGQVVSNLTATADETVTLYAKWTANEYTVTVGAGEGGSGGTTFCYTVSNSSQTKTIALPTRAGYHIVDWVISNYGGTAPSVNDRTVTIPGNTYGEFTMTPTWAANSYYVKFNKKSGDDGDMGNQEFQYDAAQALSPNLFSRTGYSFAGWATNQNGTAVYADGQIVSNLTAQANGTVYIYATWTPNTYTVTLNANGGAVDPTSVDVTYDDAWPTLPTPTLDGYAFAGWYDDAEFKNATRTNYNVAVTNNTTIYAKWTAKTYKVSFDKNSTEAAGNMQNEDFDYGVEKALTSNAFTRTGYTFAGWAKSADGQVEYTDGQIVSNLTTAASDVVPLFAAWTPIEYTIAFNGNKADNPNAMAGDSIPVAYDAVVTLPESKFVKAGRSFKAWQYGNVTYAVGAGVSNLTTEAGATVAFSAVWSELRYAAFDGNGADDAGAMIDDVMTFDGVETKNLTPNKFEKTGYTFGGWATNETDAAALNAAYTDGADVVSTNLWMEAGKTNVFYAVWQTNTYTVVFKRNGGNGNMAPQTFVYDQPKQLTPCAFTANLKFAGWATNSTGEVVFNDKAEVSNLTANANGIVNLYAVWDNGNLSKAMHCDNLVWVSSGGDEVTSDWDVVEGVDEGYESSGSSAFVTMSGNESSSYVLNVPSSTLRKGRISFCYKMSSKSDCWLEFVDDGKLKTIDPCTEWTLFEPIEVENIEKVALSFNVDSFSDQEDNYTVWIDQMTWVPDGVEPTEGDMPTINGFTATVDGFTLSVDDGNISDSFSYQILATNELVSGDWPVKTNLTAEAIKAGYDIVPEANEPKMFYKVKVVPKQ